MPESSIKIKNDTKIPESRKTARADQVLFGGKEMK